MTCVPGQVKTLKMLSMMKLQQLCTLMEEETFADDEHIVTEGEIGEKFYITIAGTVSENSSTLGVLSP